MRLALSTLDAMAGLPKLGYGTVETNQIVAAQLQIFRIHHIGGQRTFILTLVVMHEDTWYVDTIWARHAVFAVVARNVLHGEQLAGNVVVEEPLLFLIERYERTIGEQVVAQVFHVGHA